VSESEKFEAQGRAHAALRESRSKIATIAAELRRCQSLFESVATDLALVASQPSALRQDALARGLDLLPAADKIRVLAAEFATEQEKAAELEDRISRF